MTRQSVGLSTTVPTASLRLLSQVDELGPLTIGALATADRCSQPTMSAGDAVLFLGRHLLRGHLQVDGAARTRRSREDEAALLAVGELDRSSTRRPAPGVTCTMCGPSCGWVNVLPESRWTILWLDR